MENKRMKQHLYFISFGEFFAMERPSIFKEIV